MKQQVSKDNSLVATTVLTEQRAFVATFYDDVRRKLHHIEPLHDGMASSVRSRRRSSTDMSDALVASRMSADPLISSRSGAPDFFAGIIDFFKGAKPQFELDILLGRHLCESRDVSSTSMQRLIFIVFLAVTAILQHSL